MSHNSQSRTKMNDEGYVLRFHRGRGKLEIPVFKGEDAMVR